MNYLESKLRLRDIAIEAKEKFKDDKPAIRQIINDTAHMLVSEFPPSMSDARKEQCSEWLHSYAANLHPKS